jgi:putative flippase GtrA
VEVPRVSAFALVGCAGFLVQLSVLEALTLGLDVPHVAATACAVELAILHNFVWHERWTWADRASREPKGIWRRLGRFHLGNGVVSLVGNLVITAGIVTLAGVPLLLANTLAVGACTALNFVAADRLVFPDQQEVEG